jgi:hypothetical protein
MQGIQGVTANITSYTNTGNNRVITSVDANTIKGEENLNFDGTNLGIGTTSPDTLLELVSANPILTIRDTETTVANSDARLRLAESGGGDILGDYFDIRRNGTSLTIEDTGNERFKILVDGSITIPGDLNVQGDLIVTGTITAANFILSGA